jgi:hypothetical protein
MTGLGDYSFVFKYVRQSLYSYLIIGRGGDKLFMLLVGLEEVGFTFTSLIT